jgi:hypothetical protein
MARARGPKNEEIRGFTAVTCALSSPRRISERVELARTILTRDLIENEITRYFEDRMCLHSSRAVIVEHLLE